jgi:hypothetical protein
MKKQMRLGLVVEGNATSSPVLRLPCLMDELGPIKSVGLQLARRVSNAMRAGYAVAGYKDLEGAQLILLRLPDSQTPRVVAELCKISLPFRQMAFVLCESWLTTDVLAPLQQQGAQIASLVAVGPLSQNCFVVEGDLGAVRKTKRLLSLCETRVIELKPGTKSRYFAANLLSTALSIPLFQLAQQALRESGVSGDDLAILTNEWADLLQNRVRKGARGAWGGPLAECGEAVANEHFRRLAQQNPDLAATLQEWLSLARRHMAKRAKNQTV